MKIFIDHMHEKSEEKEYIATYRVRKNNALALLLLIAKNP
jgi:hypothetical protein